MCMENHIEIWWALDVSDRVVSIELIVGRLAYKIMLLEDVVIHIDQWATSILHCQATLVSHLPWVFQDLILY